MTRSELLAKITENLAVIVDEPKLELSEQSSADDVAEWDSVNHVKLIIALEKDLGIRFEPDEIASMENVGELIDLIQRKMQK